MVSVFAFGGLGAGPHRGAAAMRKKLGWFFAGGVIVEERGAHSLDDRAGSIDERALCAGDSDRSTQTSTSSSWVDIRIREIGQAKAENRRRRNS
jgi:hypothetical protein